MNTTRRSLITGLIAFVAAPAIVRAGSLMPIKVLAPEADYYICTGIMYSFNKHGIEHIYVESTDGKTWSHYRSPWILPYDL